MVRLLRWTRSLDDKWQAWVVLTLVLKSLAVALWFLGDHGKAVISGAAIAVLGSTSLLGALDVWPVRYRRGLKFRGRSSGGWDRFRR